MDSSNENGPLSHRRASVVPAAGCSVMSKIILPSRRKLLLGAASLIAAPAIVRAQIISDEGVFGSSAAAGYTGPGDIVSFTRWGGLRAYSAATIGQNVLTLIRASDSTTQTFVSLANGSLDIASITTFLAATTGKVTALYDQVGNTAWWQQGTDANRPAFTISGFNSLPEMTFSANADLGPTSGAITQAQPYSLYGAARRTSGSSAGMIISPFAGTNANFGFNNAANQVRLRASTTIFSATCADANPHCIIGLLSGASSSIWINGAQTTGSTETNGLSSDSLAIGGDTAGRQLLGYIKEVGYLGADITSHVASLNSNVVAYWGF